MTRTFCLDGKAVLPASSPPDTSVHPVNSASVNIDEADVVPGQVLFTGNCAACHGLNVISAGAPAPDLRESRVAVDRNSLWSVVHDGAMLERGMPRFDHLGATQVRQIHAYIISRAREALGKRPDSQPQTPTSR
jgi:quinohemoprotein ethanol dehydrogenase